MKYIFLFIGIIIASCSCSRLFTSEKLTLQKKAYNGKELRIDGYYYYKYYPSENKEYYDTYFFFQNGVVLNGGVTDVKGLPKLENDFKTARWQNVSKKYKISWGLFNIIGNKILFERWYPHSPGQPRVYIREGKILNDTTFHITVSYRPDGSERCKENEIYHFKQFSPKPDSTNNYIR